uniref:Uncharacterized protein n=1 Tax=Geospiza parvula TaxID=87175 RepID=A0A8C3QDM8_GEOPR
TPLGVTAECGHCDVLEHLNHNDRYSRKEKFTSALADDRVAVLLPAARGCSLGCIALLLKDGGSGTVPGGAGLLPIHKVAYEEHHLGRKYLIAVTSQTLIQESGSSTVHSAVDSQNQCVELVIENGLDVNTLLSEHITSNTYDDRRETALCHAVSNNEILCTNILLKAGANPNKDPLNCVLGAVRADSHGIVKLLLSHGYNVEMCLDFMCQGIFGNSFVWPAPEL